MDKQKEIDQWEDQREAMFDAWKRKEESKVDFKETELGKWLLQKGFEQSHGQSLIRHDKTNTEILIEKLKDGYNVCLTLDDVGYYGECGEVEFEISDGESVKRIIDSLRTNI